MRRYNVQEHHVTRTVPPEILQVIGNVVLLAPELLWKELKWTLANYEF